MTGVKLVLCGNSYNRNLNDFVFGVFEKWFSNFLFISKLETAVLKKSLHYNVSTSVLS